MFVCYTMLRCWKVMLIFDTFHVFFPPDSCKSHDVWMTTPGQMRTSNHVTSQYAFYCTTVSGKMKAFAFYSGVAIDTSPQHHQGMWLNLSDATQDVQRGAGMKTEAGTHRAWRKSTTHSRNLICHSQLQEKKRDGWVYNARLNLGIIWPFTWVQTREWWKDYRDRHIL